MLSLDPWIGQQQQQPHLYHFQRQWQESRGQRNGQGRGRKSTGQPLNPPASSCTSAESSCDPVQVGGERGLPDRRLACNKLLGWLGCLCRPLTGRWSSKRISSSASTRCRVMAGIGKPGRAGRTVQLSRFPEQSGADAYPPTLTAEKPSGGPATVWPAHTAHSLWLCCQAQAEKNFAISALQVSRTL